MNNQLKKIRSEIKKQNLDALLISSVPNIAYLTGYTGFSLEEREAYLLITKTKQYVLTDARYSEAVKEVIPHFTLMLVGQGRSSVNHLKSLANKHSLSSIGFEAHNLSVAEYTAFRKVAKFIPAKQIIELVREVKNTSEIAAIEKACKIGDKAFAYIVNFLKPGKTEKEIALELELFIKQQHADLSFKTIAAFGKNAAIPHHLTGGTKLKQKDIVLLDFGVKVDGYCSDMTRTVFVGTPSAEQSHMYTTVLEAQKRAIEYLKSYFINHKSNSKPIEASGVDKVARTYIESQGYPTIPHSLGHGIGREVHELPRLSPKSNSRLIEGMVFSVEPGIYFAGKVGVRIEDLVVIEKDGPRLLTRAPKNLMVV